MNMKLILSYDGTAYHGWQIQKNGITVQETVKKAIKRITGEDVNLIGCGRTDAGVHALNYSCNFKTNTNIPPERFKGAVNSQLPEDIRCTHAEFVDEDFHASYSAVGKTYIYRICNRPEVDVFERNYVWHYKYPVDIKKMQAAAEAFKGEHDFIGFAAAGFTVSTTIRTIYDLKVTEDNGLITIEVTGNGFLYNMVRIIAGTLIMMGNGKIDYQKAAEILASKDRKRAGITAPPRGLFLKEVYYEERK